MKIKINGNTVEAPVEDLRLLLNFSIEKKVMDIKSLPFKPEIQNC